MKIPKPLITLRLDPYGWRLVLFDDKAQFNAYSTAFGAPKEHEVTTQTGRCSIDFVNHLLVVGVFRHPVDGSPSMPGCLAHELLHGVIEVFDHIGLPVDASASEAACYMLAHLFDPCFEALYREYRWVKRPAKRR